MVLIISLALVALFVVWGALAPMSLAAVMQMALGSTIANFGWFYLLSMFGFLVFALYLAFGRFGTIRLGGEDAEPDFSRHSWFAMLFAAGMGIGLVFWGVADGAFADQVRQKIAAALAPPLECLASVAGAQGMTIGAAIGVAFFPQDGKDAETLIKLADHGMYEDKEAGRKPNDAMQ